MNTTTINFVIGFMMACISLTMIPSAINAQTLFPNEAAKQYHQQQYPNSGLSFQDFENFLQFMNYYMSLYGPNWQDQVIKIYEDDDDDDDDDNDDDHDHDKKNDWKKWFEKHHKKGDWKDNDRDDKKKYCEGKGDWNGHKCVIDNDEDRTAFEDAVCDNKPGSNSKMCGKDDKDNKYDDYDNNKEQDQEESEFSFISDDDNDNSNNEEVEEQEEPSEEKEEDDEKEESKDDSSDDSDDDDGGDDDGGDDGDSDDDGGDGGEN